MQYQGGKSRIASEVARVISTNGTGGGTYKVSRRQEPHSTANRGAVEQGGCLVSLFCGTCSVESKVTGFDRIVCNDRHPYLIAMLKGVQSGYELPETVSESEYKHIRSNKDEDPVLAGFVGFGCSFGGKWFGGYARNKGGTNYASQSKRSLLKDMARLKNAEFTCLDYRDVPIPSGAVVYADPPYANTTGYNHEPFDTEAFWDYMRTLAKSGHAVFVSEQAAPPDFVSVWEKPIRRQLDANKNNQFQVTEKLFTYQG